MGIEFNEEQFVKRTAPKHRERGTTGFLVRKGLVRDLKQANIVLLIITAVAFGSAVFIFTSATPDAGPEIVPRTQQP